MSANKIHKQTNDSTASSDQLREPTDRLVWEMRNFRQFYHGRSPNFTPSSTVLNSPDLDHDRMEHYNKFSDELRNEILDEGPGSVDHRFENRLYSGRSPTSSLSSENITNPDPHGKKKVIESLQITNLNESPRRLGGFYQPEPGTEVKKEKINDVHRLSMRSPQSFPGFPQVSLKVDHLWFLTLTFDFF